MKTIQRPVITVKRVFTDKRPAMEAFAALLARELDARSVRTFEKIKKPHYADCESEGKRYGTST